MREPISELIEALMCLPGVGSRSAERMAYHLLLNAREKGLHLANTLEQAMSNVTHCQLCNNFSHVDVCHLCRSSHRNQRQLCIVEMPLDVRAIEKSSAYSGQYFVLMGCLSPLDGIGPAQLGIDKLIARCQSAKFDEIIFALNTSVEAEATVQYLSDRLQSVSAKFSQLARGIPMGGELSFLDSSTVGGALAKRANLLNDNV